MLLQLSQFAVLLENLIVFDIFFLVAQALQSVHSARISVLISKETEVPDFSDGHFKCPSHKWRQSTQKLHRKQKKAGRGFALSISLAPSEDLLLFRSDKRLDSEKSVVTSALTVLILVMKVLRKT